MSPFSKIASKASSSGLQFLIIGGHAVNAYGYQRTTLDIDILIAEEELSEWKELLSQLGYIWGHETESFVQFKEPEGSEEFPVDLMIVNASTFAKLNAQAVGKPFGEIELKIPRPLDLIALKLHALRSPVRVELGKDLPDILALIRLLDLDLPDPDLCAILDRYATEQIKDAVRRGLSAGR